MQARHNLLSLIVLTVSVQGCADTPLTSAVAAKTDATDCGPIDTGVFDALLVPVEAVNASTAPLQDGFVPTRTGGPQGGYWVSLGVFGAELPPESLELSIVVTTPRGELMSETARLVPAPGLDGCVSSVAVSWGVSETEVSELLSGDASLQVDVNTLAGDKVFSTTLAVGAE